mgnify:CR=1 FL=1
MKKRYIVFLLFFIFVSCEKEELAINIEGCTDETASNYNQYANISNYEMCKYGSTITQIPLTVDYRYQVYYNMNSKNIISTNLKTDWDLAFENGNEGFHVKINSSKFSQITEINNISFEDVNSFSNPIWKWDNPNSSLDSTAIGDYRNSNNTVWILDRGYNINGNPIGYKKFIIDTVTNNYYRIKYANLDNSETIIVQIEKNKNTNFTQYSFKTNAIVEIEPPNNSWDLLFTQYTELFEDNIDVPAYLVTGVLTNHESGIKVAIDNYNNFDSITYNIATSYSFSSQQDAIGYNWKNFDFDNNIYTVNSNINYLIKDSQERYFKLRFINFYNQEGEKGYPTFEIEKL